MIPVDALPPIVVRRQAMRGLRAAILLGQKIIAVGLLDEKDAFVFGVRVKIAHGLRLSLVFGPVVMIGSDRSARRPRADWIVVDNPDARER